MRAFVGIAVALAFVSGPALAADDTVDKEDKIICKRDKGPEFGSHMRATKKCMKKSEWKLVSDHTRRELRTINNRGNNPGMAGGR